jgi:hypothetical protein
MSLYSTVHIQCLMWEKYEVQVWWFVWCLALTLKYYGWKQQNGFYQWKFNFREKFWNTFFMILQVYTWGNCITAQGQTIIIINMSHCSRTVGHTKHVSVLTRSDYRRTKISLATLPLVGLEVFCSFMNLQERNRLQVHLSQIQICWQSWLTNYYTVYLFFLVLN